jgi:hypothetical protein
MISREPLLHVGILEGSPTVTGSFKGPFTGPDGRDVSGPFHFSHDGAQWKGELEGSAHTYGQEIVEYRPARSDVTLRLDDVTIGVSFHWERKERQVFRAR